MIDLFGSDPGGAALSALLNGNIITGTVNLTFGGTTTDGTVTHLTVNSRWLKIGRLVFIAGRINVSAITAAPTGSLVLRGIPFPVVTSVGTGPGGAGVVARTTTPGVETVFNFAGDSLVYMGNAGGGVLGSSLATGDTIFNFYYETV